MKKKDDSLEKVVINRFILFTVLALALYALISTVIKSIADYKLSGSLTKNYMMECSSIEDYHQLDQRKLNSLGGWIEILDENFNRILPESNVEHYTSGDILALTNGIYEVGNKTYRGIMSSFLSEGNQQYYQIIFFPSDKIGMVPNLHLNLEEDIFMMILVVIVAIGLFILGYFLLIQHISRDIKETFIEPIRRLTEAFTEVGNENYEVRVNKEKYADFIKMEKSFNKMVELLQVSNEKNKEQEFLRRQLISDLSHDIKSPITVIQGYTMTLLNDKTIEQSKTERALELIYKNCQEVLRLLSRIMDYNYLQRVDYRLHKDEVDMIEFIREIILENYQSIEEHNIKLECSLPDKQVYIKIDRGEMRRVITNLFTNAVLHNSDGVKILVEIIECEEGIHIAVADTGDYIEERIIKNIFEPFTKGMESRGNSKNNGLGLSIAKKIIDKHGGELRIIQPYKEFSKAFVIEMEIQTSKE